MISGPCVSASERLVAAAEQPRDGIEQLGRLGRQRQELAGTGADGLEDQSAVGASARRQNDRVRVGLREFLDQLEGLVGSWSRTTIVTWATISLARAAASW